MESIEKQSLVAKNTSCANSSSIVTEAHGVNTEQISNLKQSVVVTVEYLNSEDFIKKFKKSSGPKNDDNKNSGPEVIITRLSGNQDVDMSGNDTAVKPKQAEVNDTLVTYNIDSIINRFQCYYAIKTFITNKLN